MNERTWWSTHVKPLWHQPQRNWLAWKVQDAVFKGLPDVICLAVGQVAWVELKYEPTPGKAEMFIEQSVKPKGYRGLTVEQRNHLAQWRDAGGRSFGFFGVANQAFLLPLELIHPKGMTMGYMEHAAREYGFFCQAYSQFVHVMPYLAARR